jgi:branched-chain amino acid transport system permease protein
VDWSLIFENAMRAAFSSDAIIFALAGMGLNVHFGYTGLPNFGQVAFVAAGAYSVAVGVSTFGWSIWLALFVGILVALVLALLLGVPTLRLRSDYLAIVTIAAGEIVRLVLRANSYRGTTGGSDGLQAFANRFYQLNPFDGQRYGIWIVDFSRNRFWVVVVGWLLVGLVALLLYLLVNSPWGRVLKAIREDEDAVRSLGKDVFRYKMQSLALGGVLGALAGFVFAIDRQSVQPDNYSTNLTFIAYTALILGGVARVGGPIVGAMIYWFVMQGSDVLLRQAIDAGYIDGFLRSNEVGIIRNMLTGLLLMLLVIFRPQGIVGDKAEVAVSVRR